MHSSPRFHQDFSPFEEILEYPHGLQGCWFSEQALLVLVCSEFGPHLKVGSLVLALMTSVVDSRLLTSGVG